jgi:hypothetical protein
MPEHNYKIPLSKSTQDQNWSEIKSSDGKPWYCTCYRGVYVDLSFIEFKNSDFNITLDWYIRRGKKEWNGPQEEFPKDFPIDLLKQLSLWRIDRMIKDTEMILGIKEAKHFKQALNAKIEEENVNGVASNKMVSR